MKSIKAQILEAYNQDIKKRLHESATVKPGDTVELHYEGTRYIVQESSVNFEDVKAFDTTGNCASYRKNCLNEGVVTTWVAFTDEYGENRVLPYGEDGVTLVGQTTNITEASKEHTSVMNAYSSMFTEMKGDDDYMMTEKDVASEADLKEFANAIAKKAFGDDVDQAKVDAIVKNAVDKSDGDWGKAAGIVAHSFN